MKYKINKSYMLELKLTNWFYVRKRNWVINFIDRDNNLYIWETCEGNKTSDILVNPSKKNKFHRLHVRIIDNWKGNIYINYVKIRKLNI